MEEKHFRDEHSKMSLLHGGCFDIWELVCGIAMDNNRCKDQILVSTNIVRKMIMIVIVFFILGYSGREGERNAIKIWWKGKVSCIYDVL